MNLEHRIMAEAQSRTSVSVALLDTIMGAPREEIQTAFTSLVQNGYLELHDGPEGGYCASRSRSMPDEKALLAILTHRPRDLADLQASVSWAPRVLAYAVQRLEKSGHVARDSAGVITPTEAGKKYAGWDQPPEPRRAPLPQNLPPVPKRDDQYRQQRRDAVALAWLRTVWAAPMDMPPPDLMEDIARMAYAWADAVEGAR